MNEALLPLKELIPIRYRKLILPAYRKYFFLPLSSISYSIKFSRNNGKKRVLFVYCNFVQDKLSYDLVKSKLVGYDVETTWWWNTSFVRAYRPDLMVLSETISPQTRELCRIVKQGNPHAQILNLHGEGSFSPRVEAYWCSGKGEDWEIVWGETAKSARIRHGANGDTIFVCGCPRFDRYANGQHISRHQLNNMIGNYQDKKIVLYATNFLLRSPDLGRFFTWDHDKYAQLRMDITTAMFNIAKRHPELFLLVKLHPSELDDMYTKMVANMGLTNVKIIGRQIHKEDVFSYDIIPNIDVLVHWASTISTEAWMCGKPTISALFHDFGDATPDLVRGSEITTNESELERAIIRLLNDPSSQDQQIKEYQQQFIKKWYYNIDGKSTDRVKEVVDGILEQNIQVQS